MTDAPETIWARPDPYEPDWTGDKTLRSKSHVEYRRADLVAPATPHMPLTTEQIMSDPRVKALVDALEQIEHMGFDMPATLELTDDQWRRRRTASMQAIARTALAQLKDHKP